MVKLNQEIKTSSGVDLAQYGIDYSIENEVLTLNGKSDSTNTFILANLNLKPNTYNFSMKYVLGSISSDSYLNIRDKDNNNLKEITASNNDVDGSFTNSLEGKFLTMYISSGRVFNNYKIQLQLEQGSTPTSYVPHSEQNISFPLAQGQKLMEGDYPDDDEKVHHNRIRIVLDGSDDEVFDKSTDTNEIRYYLPINMKLSGRILTNYFMQRQSSSDKNYVRAVATEPVNTIMFKSELLNTDNMTIQEWRQWLSTHNLEIEYELAEEQTEAFTSEQQTAWEQIKALRTYKPVTHISSEDETPADVEVEYVRDINTIDDRITALEAKVALLEE